MKLEINFKLSMNILKQRCTAVATLEMSNLILIRRAENARGSFSSESGQISRIYSRQVSPSFVFREVLSVSEDGS